MKCAARSHIYAVGKHWSSKMLMEWPKLHTMQFKLWNHHLLLNGYRPVCHENQWCRNVVNLPAISVYFSPFSFERQKCMSLLMRLLFLLTLSVSAGAAVSSNLSLLPFAEPGMSLLRLARLARFQAWPALTCPGPENDTAPCSVEERVPALDENRGMMPVETLSVKEGRSSFDPRKAISRFCSPV